MHGGHTAAAADGLPHQRVTFAHHSEHQLARLLDGHRVRWEYEPHTFVLTRDAEVCPVPAFTPDFWLPDLERYLDVTPLDQRLVSRKLVALRRLREVHPDVDVTLVHQRDYRALLVAPVGGLSRRPTLPGRHGGTSPLRSAG